MKSFGNKESSAASGSSAFFQKKAEQHFFNSVSNPSPFFSNQSPVIQTKLTIGQPNDKYEQEADAMADKVVQRLATPEPLTHKDTSVQTKPLSATITPFIQTKCAACEQEGKLQKKEEEDLVQESPLDLQRKPIFESNAAEPADENNIQRKCAECEKEEKLQKKEDLVHKSSLELHRKPIFESNAELPDENNIQRKCSECEKEDEKKVQTKNENNSTQTALSSIENNLNSSKGSGDPLPEKTRTQMESSFDADFSNVRIHNNNSAIQMSNDLKAQAFTHGSDIYFNSGKYDTNSNSGKHLLAHELTHVVQQKTGLKRKGINTVMKASDECIMRSPLFNSTIHICQRVLKSRTFHVSNGGLKAKLYIREPDLNAVNCKNHPFYLTLTKVKDWWFDSEISNCTAVTNSTTSLTIGSLSEGDYYFTIWRNFDHPYCCVDGEIEVFDEPSDSTLGCEAIKQQTTLEIVHDILDAAGFIPVLGAVPDGINAIIYATEGDWTNVGISAIAMIPEFGDAASLVMKGEKMAIRIEAKAAAKLEKEAVEAGLKEAKAVAKKVEKEALEKAEKEALEKAEKEAAEKAEKEAAEKAEKEAAEKKKKEKKGDEKKTCATSYPLAINCSRLPFDFKFPSPQAALKVLKMTTGRNNLKLVSPNPSTGGPCPGVGMHYGVKDGSEYIASISCCPCCVDSPAGPKLVTRCRII